MFTREHGSRPSRVIKRSNSQEYITENVFYFLEKLAIHNEYLYISAVINQNSTCFFPFYMFMLQNLQKKSAVYQKRPTQKHSSHYATYSRLSLPITNRIPLYFNPSCKRAQKAILWVSLYP